MNLSVSSTFVDLDAYNLVKRVLESVDQGRITNSEVICIISTREIGDNSFTDEILTRLARETTVPIVAVSARKSGRSANRSEEMKKAYDGKFIQAIKETCGQSPDVNMMLGDMIIKGEGWCSQVPSLNLHPDLPLAMGGKEGIYWNVIGKWVLSQRREIGGMIHLATPELDAGTAVAYFRLPAAGIISEVNLAKLWKTLPEDPEQLQELVSQQASLKDKPTHPLFQELRNAEAQFEPPLVEATLQMLATGEIHLMGGEVLDREGQVLTAGLDLTTLVVGESTIWPESECSPHGIEVQV